jgi:NAD(P)H-dependent flavin oxidoreductase YrpB (nitropropane dioxygenase family)
MGGDVVDGEDTGGHAKRRGEMLMMRLMQELYATRASFASIPPSIRGAIYDFDVA